MTKTLNVHFEDVEFAALEEKKGKQSWHDMIMSLVYGVEAPKKEKGKK